MGSDYTNLWIPLLVVVAFKLSQVNITDNRFLPQIPKEVKVGATLKQDMPCSIMRGNVMHASIPSCERVIEFFVKIVTKRTWDRFGWTLRMKMGKAMYFPLLLVIERVGALQEAKSAWKNNWVRCNRSLPKGIFSAISHKNPAILNGGRFVWLTSAFSTCVFVRQWWSRRQVCGREAGINGRGAGRIGVRNRFWCRCLNCGIVCSYIWSGKNPLQSIAVDIPFNHWWVDVLR